MSSGTAAAGRQEAATSGSSTAAVASGRDSELALGRTSTRDSVRTTGSQEGSSGLSSILSNTKNFFRKRGSISAADSHQEYGSSGVNEPLSAQRQDPATATGTLPPPLVPSTTRSPPPGTLNLPKPIMQTGVPFDFGGSTSVAVVAAGPQSEGSSTAVPAAPQRIASPNMLGRGSSDESRASVSTIATTSTAPSSVMASPSGAPLSLGHGQPASVQARMKTLPRLASYTVPEAGSSSSHITAGSGESAATARAGEAYDTSTTMSGTDTEQEPSDMEDDEDDEDDGEDDDEEHGEEDVRGGVAAMRTNFQRPALPTLASRSGGLNRLSSAGGGAAAPRMTPFMASPPTNPFQFQGWTTFASSTPTPGPMRTARPGPNDNTPNGSYFDARPVSSSSTRAYGTPAQTPRPMSGDVTGIGTATPGSAGRFRSQMQPIATPGASPASRIRIDTRNSSISPYRSTGPGSAKAQSSIVTTSGQSFPASSIPPIPQTPGGRVMPSLSSSERPSFYQRQSRSLVDLSRSLEPEEPVNARLQAAVAAANSASSSRPTSSAGSVVAPIAEVSEASTAPDAEPSSTPAEAAPAFSVAVPPTHNQQLPQSIQSPQTQARLRPRRNSMPEMRIDPPVYQIDDDFFIQYRKNAPIPMAREDEGSEALPAYSCDVHIEGWVPRKMEFLKPGVQAKDRRWKRQYVILHGTSIKIYRADPRTKAVQGDDAPPTPGIHKENFKPQFPVASSASSLVGRSAAASTASSASSTAAAARARAQTMSSMSSTSSASTIASTGTTGSEKLPTWSKTTDTMNSRRFDPDIPVHVHAQDEEEHGLASLQHAPSTLLAKAGENRCIRHYTLQGEPP